MTIEVPIEIPLSKSKMTRTILGSLIFLGLGTWFLVNPPQNFNNPILVLIIGITSILFFLFNAIIIFRKLSDKKSRNNCQQTWYNNNSSGVSAVLIPWEDIKEIKVSQVMSQKFLMLILKKPHDYLDKVSNPIKRNTMKLN